MSDTASAVYWIIFVLWSNGNSATYVRPEFASYAECASKLSYWNVTEAQKELRAEGLDPVLYGCVRSDVNTAVFLNEVVRPLKEQRDE